MQDLDRDDLTHVRGGFGLLGGLLANRPILGSLLGRFGAGAGVPGSGAPAGGNPSAAAAMPQTQPTRASGGCGS